MAEKNQNKGKKPWEQMYAGKGDAKKNTGKAPADKKPAGKKPEKQGGRKSTPEFRDFLYLLPKRTSAKQLAGVLTFLPKEAVEVWEDECVLEISEGGSVVTFEDIRDSLEKEDKQVLSDLRMKQVLACDYTAADADLVRRIMDAFVKNFGGKIGSDTEDFTPFLSPEEL